jgi:hypothetical protein
MILTSAIFPTLPTSQSLREVTLVKPNYFPSRALHLCVIARKLSRIYCAVKTQGIFGAVVAQSYRWTRYTVNTCHINTLTCEFIIITPMVRSIIGIWLPGAGHKLVRVWRTTEVQANWTSKRSHSPAFEKKGRYAKSLEMFQNCLVIITSSACPLW